MPKKISTKWLLVLVPLLLLPLIVGQAGYCSKDNLFHHPQDLTQAVLSNAPDNQLSCRPIGVPSDAGGVWQLLNVAVGRKLEQVQCVYPKRKASDSSETYYLANFTVDSCGTIIDTSGSEISITLYNSSIETNKNYWKETQK